MGTGWLKDRQRTGGPPWFVVPRLIETAEGGDVTPLTLEDRRSATKSDTARR
jgi:hypothetical protein